MLVSHAVLTLPNYVVIGVPVRLTAPAHVSESAHTLLRFAALRLACPQVLSSMFPASLVKTFMGLLLMEQVSLHLTFIAVMAELFCAKAPAPAVGEHALGALHLNGPPLRTDAHGWALGVVGAVLSRSGGAPAEAEGAGLGSCSASATKGEELKPRLSRSGSLQAEHAAALLSAPDGVEADAEAGCVPHVMPEHSNSALRVLRIVRDRLLHNPMVMGAVAGVITTLAVKARDRQAKLPFVSAALLCCLQARADRCRTAQILDTTSLYLNNCVLGISLFNFGKRLCCDALLHDRRLTRHRQACLRTCTASSRAATAAPPRLCCFALCCRPSAACSRACCFASRATSSRSSSCRARCRRLSRASWSSKSSRSSPRCFQRQPPSAPRSACPSCASGLPSCPASSESRERAAAAGLSVRACA
jgi:hypothetical protein